MVYNFVTKEGWKILHGAMLWYWTIIHFQLCNRILVATHLTMISCNKTHGLLSRTEYYTLSHYVISAWDLKGTVEKFNINWCCYSWKWRAQNICTLQLFPDQFLYQGIITSEFLAEIMQYTEPQLCNKFIVILDQYSSLSIW